MFKVSKSLEILILTILGCPVINLNAITVSQEKKGNFFSFLLLSDAYQK